MRTLFGIAVSAILFFGPAVPGRAAEPKKSPSNEEMKEITAKAIEYVKKNQAEDGSWSKQLGGPGVTALVLAALVRHGVPADDPVITKAIEYLSNNQQKDGGIYDRRLANYTTSVAILALKEVNKDGQYDKVIMAAVKFLKGIQAGADESIDEKKPEYGGAGYDQKSRPDLSNTHFFVEALAAAGVDKNDPAMKRAITFISRCQNLPGEFNKQPWAKLASDDDKGGFIYTPADGGKSNAGKNPDGGLRSAGVMTYAGLKSFLYAGVDRKDPRVVAAVGWIKRHYTVEENPGQGKGGLYYYYHVFAKAMDALGDGEIFEDAKGSKHNWKRDLFEAIKSRQNKDGTWINDEDKFYEGDGNLCAAYCLLALAYCK